MNTMLNFKYGLFSNLPDDKSAGTIYVTTDEKAMYVDLPSAGDATTVNRIRLSQIITLSTQEWQNLTPPYSTEAFYYIFDANALLKYNGTQWVQLNSTADLDNALSALGFLGLVNELPTTGVKGQICTFNGQNYIYNPAVEDNNKWVAISNVGGKILDLDASLTALSTTVASLGADLATAQGDIEAIEADIDQLDKVVGYIGKVDDQPASANVGDICIFDGIIYTWVAKDGDVAAHWAELGSESKRIEDLKAEIAKVKAEAGTAEGIENLATTLNSLKATVEDENTGLAKTYEIATDAAATAGDAVPKKDFETFQAQNATNIADAKDIAEAAAAAAAEAKAEAAEKTTLDEVKAQGYITETALNGYATEDYANEAASSAANTVRGETTETVASAYALANEAKGAAATNAVDIKELNEKIETELQVADAMVYKGTVASADALPTANVSIGATYKAVEEFTMGSGDSAYIVYIGDLLIARGTEDTDLTITNEDGSASENPNFGYITSESLTWDHVPSGYRADYVPTSGVTTIENGAIINLTSAHAADNVNGDLGAIALTGEGAITITATEGTNKKSGSVAIGIAWGSF